MWTYWEKKSKKSSCDFWTKPNEWNRIRITKQKTAQHHRVFECKWTCLKYYISILVHAVVNFRFLFFFFACIVVLWYLFIFLCPAIWFKKKKIRHPHEDAQKAAIEKKNSKCNFINKYIEPEKKRQRKNGAQINAKMNNKLNLTKAKEKMNRNNKT